MAEYNAGTVKATMTADGKGYHAAVDSIKKKDQELKQSAQEVKTSYKEMGIAAGASFAAITAGIWKSIDANNQLKSAMMGLDSIASGVLGNYSKIQAELERVRKDGMIPLTNAIQAYKNLIIRYKDEEKAIQIFNRLADSASFARQGHLTLGQAIQGATEGLKNNLSMMVDNAGVTKNVSQMWKDYADQIGKTVGQLTEAEKAEAEYVGIMHETRFQVGDLAKLQGSLQGELAKSSAMTRETAAAFGDAMEPAVSAVVSAYSALMLNVKGFISTNPEVVSGATAGAFAFTGLATAMAGASALIPKLVAGFQALFIKSGPVGWGILAVSALTAAFVGLHTAQQKQLQQMKEQAKEFNQQSREIHDLAAEYGELSKKTNQTAEEKDRLKQISERLIELVPGMVKGYDDEGNAILDLNVALEAMVNKKREALQVDRQLLDREIKDAERRRKSTETQLNYFKHHLERNMKIPGMSMEQVQASVLKYEQELIEHGATINELKERQVELDKIIEGTTVEALEKEYRRKRIEKENEEQVRKRSQLEEELANRLYELTHTETEVKIRELEKRREAYEKEGVAEIEVEGQKFTLAQWYEMEKTRILDEEAEKRKEIEQELLDWQNQARMVAMDDFEKQVTRYELDRDAALEAAQAKFKDIEQLRQAEAAINQYYDHLINEARVTEFEAMIREQYKLEQQLTEWEREELLKRLQAELTVLEATTGASEERIQALKNVIKELGEEDIPTLADMTKKWNEDLVEGLSRAIAYGESLTDIFDNLLRTIAQYYLQQAIMGGLKKAGLSFHDGGKVGRFHWGGAVDAFAGAIRAHGGLKLAADEVPIIAQTGERVLSRAENVAYEAGWKPQVDIQIINNTGTPIEARRETEFDGPRTVVRFFLEGYSRNIDGIQRILQPR